MQNDATVQADVEMEIERIEKQTAALKDGDGQIQCQRTELPPEAHLFIEKIIAMLRTDHQRELEIRGEKQEGMIGRFRRWVKSVFVRP